MKLIKIDLPINGTKVKNLDELRDNLTDELVLLARSGQLTRFLKSRNEDQIARYVEESVNSKGYDKDIFVAVCTALSVPFCLEDIDAHFDSPKPRGCSLEEINYRKRYDNLVLTSEHTIKTLKSEIAQLKKQLKNYKASHTSEHRGLEGCNPFWLEKVSLLETGTETTQLKKAKPQVSISAFDNPNGPDRFGRVQVRLPGSEGLMATIVKWETNTSSQVSMGQVLCHTDKYIITSPCAGKIWALYHSAGSTVEAGSILASIEI